MMTLAMEKVLNLFVMESTRWKAKADSLVMMETGTLTGLNVKVIHAQ